MYVVYDMHKCLSGGHAGVYCYSAHRRSEVTSTLSESGSLSSAKSISGELALVLQDSSVSVPYLAVGTLR